MKTILSIIIPFYNSEEKCSRLLHSLVNFSDSEIEVICVDDGSKDSTLEILEDFKNSTSLRVKVISQENKGPGGARNAGIDQAIGEYIWLVDSDDDISINKALTLLRSVYEKNYDVIDFNISSKIGVINSMDISEGEYSSSELTKALLKKFGRIWSKIFHSRVLKHNKIRYPEYCIYEDNPLIFILPFFIKTLYKSELVVYSHHEEHDSVTRATTVSPRYFDRMYTSVWGYEEGIQLTNNVESLEIMRDHFIRLYVINTGSIGKKPSRLWIEKAKVIKKFRSDCNKLDLKVKLKDVLIYKEVGIKYKALLSTLWGGSFFLPSQEKYFENKRIEAWGKPFEPPKFKPTKAMYSEST